jgi:ketosteroid isomerase-like protein
MSDIEARLKRLEDIEAARAMFNIYASTLDEPDAKTVGQLFAEDAVLRTPMGDFQGRDAIEEFFGMAFKADPSVKRHFIVNPRVIDASDGTVRFHSDFLYVGRGDAQSIIGWGSYDDVVDTTGPEPVFREKTIAVHVGTDLASGWAMDTE